MRSNTEYHYLSMRFIYDYGFTLGYSKCWNTSQIVWIRSSILQLKKTCKTAPMGVEMEVQGIL